MFYNNIILSVRDELMSDDAVLVDLSSQLTPTSEVPPPIPVNRRKQNTLKSIWEKASSFYPTSGCQLDDESDQLPVHVALPPDAEQSDSYIVFESSKQEDRVSVMTITQPI